MGYRRAEPPHEAVLELALDTGRLPVSYLSSALRVVQATLREVARSEDGTLRHFEERPQPVLVLSQPAVEGDLLLRFTFADPVDLAPMPELSARVFEAFLERFGEFIKGLPQRGLWDDTYGASYDRRDPSPLTRRLHQLRMEMRRFTRASVRFGGRTVTIEGQRMEIT